MATARTSWPSAAGIENPGEPTSAGKTPAAPGSGSTEESAVTGVNEVYSLALPATGEKKAYCDDRPWEIGSMRRVGSRAEGRIWRAHLWGTLGGTSVGSSAPAAPSA